MDQPVTSWDVNKVNYWLSSIGYSAYESQIKEQDISGEILVHLDHEALKDLGVRSVGQRVTILKAIYNLKIQHNIPVETGEYVPPSVEFENEIYNMNGGVPDIRKIEKSIHEKDAKINQLSKELQRLSTDISKLREELAPIWKMAKENKPLPEPESNNNNSGKKSTQKNNLQVTVPDINVTNCSKSPSHANSPFDALSAPSSPRSPQEGRNRIHDLDPRTHIHLSSSNNNNESPHLNANVGLNTGRFRVSLEDPCYKVLPSALKKYKVHDDWRKYALFICFGSKDNPVERCLSYDEKPLLLFQKLKEANQNPVFMLKNIKEIKSPVATAEEILNSLKANKSKRRTTQFLNKELPPPPPPAETYPLNNSNNHSNHSNSNSHNSSNNNNNSKNGTPPSSSSSSNTYEYLNNNNSGNEEDQDEEMIVEGDCTAVAIYPYVPELDDELNVVVGDIFKIRSKSGGWCYCEKNGQYGWVPANFLLETNVNGGDIMDDDNPYVGRGIALIDYQRNTDDELSMNKDDTLRIYKKQDYWYYCELNDDRGWVPSWYVKIEKDLIDYEHEVI